MSNDLARSLGPYGARAYRYAEQVTSGEVPACIWTQRAAQRFIDDLHNDEAVWGFSPDAAHDACEFIEKLSHVKGAWARRRELIRLEDWQCFIVCNIFGFVYKFDVYDNETGDLIGTQGCRRFRTVYIEVPRKNAKSTLMAAIALYLLALDGEAGPEVYTAATSRNQAKIVFKIAKEMARRAPHDLLPNLTVHANHISDMENSGIFEPLHAEGTTMDGLNISASINDELHAWKRADTYDVIETACGSRDQPLMLNITTAGTNIDGVCFDKHLYLKKTLEASPEDRDDSFFGVIWSIDEGDDWKDRDIWAKANPNYGISVSPLDMMSLAKKAERIPRDRLGFLTKRLNQWQTAGAAWINLESWDKCADTSLQLEQFYGERCWIGVDLASKRDIAAMAILFEKTLDGKRHVYCFMRYYLPEKAITDGLQQYDGWCRRGLIRSTPGASLDVDRIEDETKELADTVELVEIAVDPGHNSTQYGVHMDQEGYTVVDVRPSVLQFSEPMKWLEAYVDEQRFHFDGCPVLTWMIGNVHVKPDHKDNIYPRKLRDANKIDGVVAIIMALNRMMAAQDSTSIYDTRGALGV